MAQVIDRTISVLNSRWLVSSGLSASSVRAGSSVLPPDDAKLLTIAPEVKDTQLMLATRHPERFMRFMSEEITKNRFAIREDSPRAFWTAFPIGAGFSMPVLPLKHLATLQRAIRDAHEEICQSCSTEGSRIDVGYYLRDGIAPGSVAVMPTLGFLTRRLKTRDDGSLIVPSISAKGLEDMFKALTGYRKNTEDMFPDGVGTNLMANVLLRNVPEMQDKLNTIIDKERQVQKDSGFKRRDWPEYLKADAYEKAVTDAYAAATPPVVPDITTVGRQLLNNMLSATPIQTEITTSKKGVQKSTPVLYERAGILRLVCFLCEMDRNITEYILFMHSFFNNGDLDISLLLGVHPEHRAIVNVTCTVAREEQAVAGATTGSTTA